MRGIAFIVLIGASGCGLSDYQRRMDAQRARVQEFDEGNRLLDDPIETPMIQFLDKDKAKRETVAWPFEIFLRLPKGYTSTPRDKAPYYNFLFRYFGGSEGGQSIFVGAAKMVDAKEEVFPGKYSPATFRSYIKPALEEYYFKIKQVKYPLQEKTKAERKEVKVVTPYPDPGAPVKNAYTFFTLSDEGNTQVKDHTAFDVYLHEKGNKQVCIVVMRPLLGSSATLKASIEASLGSLDASAEASVKSAAYKRAKGI